MIRPRLLDGSCFIPWYDPVCHTWLDSLIGNLTAGIWIGVVCFLNVKGLVKYVLIQDKINKASYLI